MTERLSVQWLAPQWSAPPAVCAVSTLRRGGASLPPFDSLNLGDHVGDAADAVRANRELLRTRAGLPAEPIWLSQVHGTRVVDVDELRESLPPQGDAAVARSRGRVCAILTADCLPVLFAARDGSVIGAAHAGWRGLAAGVLEATLEAMDVPAAAVVAWLGPAIGPAHFEVGAEVREALLEFDSGGEAAFTQNARGRYMADLWQLARRRLVRAGVNEVAGGGVCTHGDASGFFSHRRDGRSGRQATLIWRR